MDFLAALMVAVAVAGMRLLVTVAASSARQMFTALSRVRSTMASNLWRVSSSNTPITTRSRITLALILDSIPIHVGQVVLVHVRHNALDPSVKSHVLYSSLRAVKNESND